VALCICWMLTAGGRSPTGSSVITFSSVAKDTEVSDDQHRALMIYFFSLLMWGYNLCVRILGESLNQIFLQ